MPRQKEKVKEDLQSFTVGSAPAGGGKASSAAAKSGPKQGKPIKVEIRESVFPVLTNLRRGGGKDAKAFQQEMQRILLAASEVAKQGSAKEKQEAEQVQKAYALSLAILENSKIVR